MREPAFWYRPPSSISRLLTPLGAIYGAITAQRMVRTGIRADIPVFCIGNYHVGGAGKTPTTLAPSRNCCANWASNRSLSAVAMAARCQALFASIRRGTPRRMSATSL